MAHKEYVQRYIRNRFRQSWITLTGILVPSLSSLAMMALDWPANLQLLNIVALATMVGISYWWHWFYHVETLAEEGVRAYLGEQEAARSARLQARLKTIDLSPFPLYEALQIELQHKYDAFRNALGKQYIISETARRDFEHRARTAFESGLELLAEMADILIVQSSVNIDSIRKRHAKNSFDKAQLAEIIDAFEANEKKLKKLSLGLQRLSHSYTLAISQLAAVTSKTYQKEEFEASELQKAIDAAKAVQDKLHSLSGGREADLREIHMKYAKEN